MGLHTGARQLTREEWAALSNEVFNRDGWMCQAPWLDAEAGPCHDRDGRLFRQMGACNSRRVREYMTLQHVQINGRTENDAQHLLTLCWGHHLGNGEKGGRIWSKQKEPAQLQRDHLIKRYPELEAA
jgi:hypothetical protein